MVTGYEVEAYNNLARITEGVGRIAKALESIAASLEAESSLEQVAKVQLQDELIDRIGRIAKAQEEMLRLTTAMDDPAAEFKSRQNPSDAIEWEALGDLRRKYEAWLELRHSSTEERKEALAKIALIDSALKERGAVV